MMRLSGLEEASRCCLLGGGPGSPPLRCPMSSPSELDDDDGDTFSWTELHTAPWCWGFFVPGSVERSWILGLCSEVSEDISS
ncbi:hypothetical protein GDO81_025740 [Engystomops pustulosus]|uniref:Uncharacterized protein n=1 Tax=Engystomops pustulosus TaxID=76066 RepID=A0AAV6YGV8_ENGPU|nr:hypothetical protein GDO81_025740 [Engystomops pustulosus]